MTECNESDRARGEGGFAGTGPEADLRKRRSTLGRRRTRSSATGPGYARPGEGSETGENKMADVTSRTDAEPSVERSRRHRPGRRRRRPWRIALISLASLLGLVLVVAAGGYVYVNHLVSSIPRVKVAYLTAAAANSGQTFLVTASPFGPTGRNGQPASSPSNKSELFMLLHINANGKAGGAVTIPGDTVVNVPGYGTHPLWYALQKGGPSLAVQTIRDLTGDPINHYARVDFNHVSAVVNAIGGGDVTIPKTSTAFGQTFNAGVNHLTGVTAVYYARDPSLSDQGRNLRQEVLVRAALTKIGDDHLITNPV